MSETIERLRDRLNTTIENVSWLEDQIADTKQSVEFIENDLKATAEEFMETTGKTKAEFFDWRRRAKGALNHKKEHLVQANRKLDDMRLERSRLEMLLKAEESEYAGEDAERLLLALDRMLQSIMEETRYQPSEDQAELLAAVKSKLGDLDGRYA